MIDQDQFSEQELRDMTDAERTAVTDEDDAEASAAGGDGTAAGTDGGGVGPEAVIPDTDIDAGAGADAGEADKEEGGTEEEEPGDRRPFVPQYQVQPQADIQAKMGEIDAKIQDLNKQLEEGDVDFAEYNRQKDTLAEQKYDLRAEQLKSQLAEEHNKQSADQLWKWEQGQFFREHPEYKGNAILMGALQAAIHGIDGQGGHEKSGLDVLADADAMVKQAIGGGAAAKTTIPPKPGEDSNAAGGGKPPKDTKPARTKVELPKTLGGLPAADANDTAQGEFAALDRLSGVEYERALEQLSPAQQERYARG